ncbi:MAG: hypothetical protein ACREJC_15500, partial [Tepidisphaeraceae bacterium]
LGTIGITQLACSELEATDLARDHPRLAPATRGVEAIQHRLDPIAVGAQHGATIVENAADGAAALGVPGASTVALIAGVIGTVLGVYNERGKGTLPLRAAMTQIVRSVEAAFPNRTATQKTAMASMQDQPTRELVSSIKGS